MWPDGEGPVTDPIAAKARARAELAKAERSALPEDARDNPYGDLDDELLQEPRDDD